MMSAIRNIEMALGSEAKLITTSEKCNLGVIRKSIVAKGYIEKGEHFTVDNITVKRCKVGISPSMWDDVIGNVAESSYDKDQVIRSTPYETDDK